MTDFAILTGGFADDSCIAKHSRISKDILGAYWTKTSGMYNSVSVVYPNGSCPGVDVGVSFFGCRPVFVFSESSDISVDLENINCKDKILEIENGCYPRSAINKEMQEELELLFNNNDLQDVNLDLITNHRRIDSHISIQASEIYEYNGKMYVRVQARFFDSCPTFLSNGIRYNYGDYVWVEIEPIKWLVDLKKRIMITKEIILSGIQFDKKRVYKGDFDDTDIFKFMNRYLLPQILQLENLTKEIALNEVEEFHTVKPNQRKRTKE